MKFSLYILPALFLIVFLLALIKKINIYDSFTSGAKGAVELAFNLFPYLAAIFLATELFEAAGLTDKLTSFLTPCFESVGKPGQISMLVLLKPFSGSGSMALLTEIYNEYGADSYIARCAGTVYSASDTIFYIAAVYLVSCDRKKTLLPIVISLISSFFAAVVACALCRIF